MYLHDAGDFLPGSAGRKERMAADCDVDGVVVFIALRCSRMSLSSRRR
jgi:hypothetical protein